MVSPEVVKSWQNVIPSTRPIAASVAVIRIASYFFQDILSCLASFGSILKIFKKTRLKEPAIIKKRGSAIKRELVKY